MRLPKNAVDTVLQAPFDVPAMRAPGSVAPRSSDPPPRYAGKGPHFPSGTRPGHGPKRVRALFLSDIHLGTRSCQAQRLLAFLREYESDYLYLVGDIVDVWAMKRSFFWPSAHNTIVQKFLRMARHRTRIIFVPGNHDEAFRDYVGTSFGAVDIVTDHVHETADGKRLWVTHGDQYDQVTTCHRWVSVLGDVSYTALVHINRLLSLSRRKLGIGGHWSLADYAKRNVLKAVAYIGDFEKAAAHEAQQKKFDGVICGHIHTATIKTVDNVIYYNCGDWVDSCTALVEHLDGRMELMRSTPELQLASVLTAPSPLDDSAPQERMSA